MKFCFIEVAFSISYKTDYNLASTSSPSATLPIKRAIWEPEIHVPSTRKLILKSDLLIIPFPMMNSELFYRWS